MSRNLDWMMEMVRYWMDCRVLPLEAIDRWVGLFVENVCYRMVGRVCLMVAPLLTSHLVEELFSSRTTDRLMRRCYWARYLAYHSAYR